jgi:hypothetical protein
MSSLKLLHGLRAFRGVRSSPERVSSIERVLRGGPRCDGTVSSESTVASSAGSSEDEVMRPERCLVGDFRPSRRRVSRVGLSLLIDERLLESSRPRERSSASLISCSTPRFDAPPLE